MEYVTVGIPVRGWHLIDAVADNTSAVDIVEGDVVSAMTAAIVREEGWRQSAAWGGERDDHGWPPAEHALQITLRREHWEWIIDQFDRWQPYGPDERYPGVRKLIARHVTERCGASQHPSSSGTMES